MNELELAYVQSALRCALREMEKTQAAQAAATINPAFSERVRAMYGKMLAETAADIAICRAEFARYL